MSNRFSKVSPAVWRSRRFAELSGNDAKLLYLYFLTCEHQTSAGTYVIPDGYASSDLGWDLATYQKARTELVEAVLIAFDEDSSTVYVERWFQHNPPMNEKHAQSIQRLIGEMEPEVLQMKVQEDFEKVRVNRNPIEDSPNVSPELMRTLGRKVGYGTR